MKYLLPLTMVLSACGTEVHYASEIADVDHPIQAVSLESIIAGDAFDLDATTAGCYERRELSLRNDGVDTVVLRGAHVSATSSAGLLQSYLRGGAGQTLQPGEAASLLVDVYSAQSGLTTASVNLDLQINGAPQPQSLSLNLRTEDLLPVTDD